MITVNPYSNVDFSSCVFLLSNTHEHVMNQETLERCYNRGVRNINLMHYSPAAPQKFEPGYQVEYIDYVSATDTEHKTTRLSPLREYSNFVDKDGNSVDLDDIVVVPNSEQPNIIGYHPMLHTNYLGSEFAQPGSIAPLGELDPDVRPANWRKEHPIVSPQELFDGVRNSLPLGKVFGTLNHPRLSGVPASDLYNFVAESDGLIQAVEVFNETSIPSMNEIHEAFYDSLLNMGYRLWCLSVIDWQGNNAEYYGQDMGGNMLLLPSNYGSLTYVQKQNAILDAYIAGQYFPVGLGTLMITNVSVSGSNVTFTFNQSANTIYGIYDGVSRTIGTNVNTVTVDTKDCNKYFRLKALGDNHEFIYSNPIFVEPSSDKLRKTYSVLF